jgi:hypothetical protein
MLERIQLKFVAPCQYFFFSCDCVTYEGFLTFLKLHTLYNRRLKLDVLFFMSVNSGWKCCLSLLNRTSIRDFLVILDTIFCWLQLLKTIRLLDAFRLLIMCAKTLLSLKQILLYYFFILLFLPYCFRVVLCICTVFVFHLYLYASLVGTCALSPSP